MLFVRKNALQVLIPKYGLEGTIYLPDKKQSPFVFNEEVCAAAVRRENKYVFYSVSKLEEVIAFLCT